MDPEVVAPAVLPAGDEDHGPGRRRQRDRGQVKRQAVGLEDVEQRLQGRVVPAGVVVAEEERHRRLARPGRRGAGRASRSWRRLRPAPGSQLRRAGASVERERDGQRSSRGRRPRPPRTCAREPVGVEDAQRRARRAGGRGRPARPRVPRRTARRRRCRAAEDVHRGVVALADGDGRGGHLAAEVGDVAHHPARWSPPPGGWALDVGSGRNGPVTITVRRPWSPGGAGARRRRAEQRRADQPAARRHEDPPLAGRSWSRRTGARTNPCSGRARAGGRSGGTSPPGWRTCVRMDEHGVEVLVGDPAGPVVGPTGRAGCRRGCRAGCRRRTGAVRLRAASRSGISSPANFLRPNGNSSISTTSGAVSRKHRWIIDRRSPGFVDREALVPADERVVLVQAQRREVHDVDRGRLREVRATVRR